MKNEKKEKQRLSYEDIMKEKEENSEFRTGKKFKKARGAAGKIHRKFKSGGGKKKKSFGKKKHWLPLIRTIIWVLRFIIIFVWINF